MTGDLSELLDEERLEGIVELKRYLGPRQHGLAIRNDSLRDARLAIEQACQRWGGGKDMMFPFTSDGTLPGTWTSLLEDSYFDELYSRGYERDRLLGAFPEVHQGEVMWCEPLLSVLVGINEKKDDWAPVIVTRIDEDDPWFISYATALGLWPAEPDPNLLEQGGLISDIQFSSILPTEFSNSVQGSGEDLLRRIKDSTTTTPIHVSVGFLEIFSAPAPKGIPSAPILPRKRQVASEVGPNIVVVYEPGSVEDLCLLWNLRSAQGLRRGLPLGIPLGDDVASTVSHWIKEYAFEPMGFRELRGALVSCTVELRELEEIASALGNRWQAQRPDELLQPSEPTARLSSEIAVFQDGRTQVPAWGPADLDLLRSRPTRGGRVGHFNLQSLLEVRIRPLPPISSLRGDSLFECGLASRGFRCKVSQTQKVIDVRWPSGWTILSAALKDRGLRGEPSAPGRAAVAMLKQLGSVNDLDLLLSPLLIDRLHRLSERRGMTWFRSKMRELGEEFVQQAGSANMDKALDERLEQLSLKPFDEDEHHLTFDAFREPLGVKSAQVWVEWAENRRLLIRGASMVCPVCTANSWRATAELGPPIICRGCGREISLPFPPDHLLFRYRASETVLNVVAHDAVVQLLTARWLTRVFSGTADSLSPLYGFYPGVTLYEESGGDPIGEADVLLLMADGTLIPGECKRSGRGLNQEEVAKLERIADRLESPWSFFATLDSADDCPAIWRDVVRELPQPPRWSLTAEHLFEPAPFWSIDRNPFRWLNTHEVDNEMRNQEFKNRIPAIAEWLMKRRDPAEYLFRIKD